MNDINSLRPEPGATLSHLSIQSPDPARLARFFDEVYGMPSHPIDAGWRCDAPGRVFLITAGKANRVDFVAYAFANPATLSAYRSRLTAVCGTVGGNPSPIFGDSAFSVTDPDGNAVAFGVLPRSAATEQDLPARAQHVAFRTPNIEAMLAFYRDTLGFVVSDRVEDAQGQLRACFLRTDDEHHALALFASTERRLDHVSCETRDISSLVAWADRVADRGVPIHWGVGRHGPGNDVFFMVKDPDDNLIEISSELERVGVDRPVGIWPHEQRTLNLWGTAIMRS
jgi:catechol 2,3-dioxygenase-like lactoylglutathione lyase family enzyme